MESERFERLNTLSEKAMNGIATPNELKEFNQLLTTWDESIEESIKWNLLQGLPVSNPKE